MKVLNEISEEDMKTIRRIENAFKKLKKRGIVWEGIDGGAGGNLYFFNAKEGVCVTDLPKECEGFDDAAKLSLLLSNEWEYHSSNILINVTVP